MDLKFVDNTLTSLKCRLEVRDVLHDLVGDIEEWFYQREMSQSRVQTVELQQVAVRLAKRIRALQEEKQVLRSELTSIKERALEVRSKFAVDISAILMESRNTESLKARIKHLESQLIDSQQLLQKMDQTYLNKHASEKKADEWNERDSPIGESTSHPSSSIVAPGQEGRPTSVEPHDKDSATCSIQPTSPPQSLPPAPRHCILSDVSDTVLLTVFSYLESEEVLAAAQVNRFVFQRVDGLFGTDSKIIKPEWAERYPQTPQVATSSTAAPVSTATGPVASSAAATISTATKQFFSTFMEGSSANSNPLAVLLSRELTDSLAKKLSATELKAVMALNEGIKKLAAEQEKLTAEKEDLAARLQNTETVRDFLVQKLRAAEVALKAALAEAGQLRRQAAADGEVISYLDLRGQELEVQTQELEHLRQHLQASLNLQQGTFAHTEKRVSAELFEVKVRLEDCEASHRAQKKLLVKEVKLLRTQLESVTKERNIFGAQLRVLRDTLSGGL